MNILLNISIPAISENYDVFVPDFLEIGKIIHLVSKAVEEMSNARFKSSGCEVLCFGENILSPDLTLKRLGVANGDCLMLF